MLARGHLFIPVLTILAVMYAGYSAPLAALSPAWSSGSRTG